MSLSLSYPKRLIEVDLPIRAISEQARREKSIRHGHISTLHIWWARRPLAACRAVTCAALWPDPVDELCPQAFREAAALALCFFAAQVRSDATVAAICGKHAQERWFRLNPAILDARNVASRFDMRYALLDFIADFSNWDASTLPAFLEPARLLTHAAHLALSDPNWKLPVQWDRRDSFEGMRDAMQALKDALEHLPRPLVVDPFAGGGAIPLEALRVGADSYASDLNPVAILLNKVVQEYIPKYGNTPIPNVNNISPTFDGLAEAVRYWGTWLKEQAENELQSYYPKSIDGAGPIAYLWARTIKCEGPGCGTEIPLMRSLWLAKKNERSIALQIVPDANNKKVDFEIIEKRKGKWVRQANPSSELEKPNLEGTVRRGSATCPICGFTTPVEHLREQLSKRKGGTSDSRLICVVFIRDNQKNKQPDNSEEVAQKIGRLYRLPTSKDLDALTKIDEILNCLKSEQSMNLIPDEYISLNEIRRISVPLYGLVTWDTLFLPRQLIVLTTLIRNFTALIEKLSGNNSSKAILTCLALAISRQTDYSTSLCSWHLTGEKINHTFGRQAIPMIWDFAESVPFSSSSGSFMGAIEWVAGVCKTNSLINNIGHVQQASATDQILPDDIAHFYFTDPPYYDAVPYAYLSDFFYVWLKRMLLPLYPELFEQTSVPKSKEIVVDRPHRLSNSSKDINFYEKELTKAFGQGRKVLSPSGIGTIVFASKTTSSWEAILKAVIDAGWTITGSWPIDTEMEARVAAQGQARLASSIHLVCRPRETINGEVLESIGDWRDVLQELPNRINSWLPHLAQEGVVGADAIFACLGPSLEIFSRYSRVEKASGETVTLNEYLTHIWAAVSHVALGMIFEGGDATGFEEDARLTAMWLWTLKTESEVDLRINEASQLAMEEESSDEDENEGGKEIKISGFELEYDAARKIAQGLGVHLERLDGLVQVKGDKARLLGVSDRAQILFGKDDALLSSQRKKKIDTQMTLFSVLDEAEAQAGDWGEKNTPKVGETTLDRIHQVMLLFASGRNEAIKRFLVEEGVGKDNRFWRLAQALSALYPSGTDEKRWVDGVLARKKGLGF